MTSLACSALPAIGPGAPLRRGTRWCTPFSQLSACNIVFSPHNAALHTGFITPCQSARGSGVSVQKQQDMGCVRGTGDVLVLYGLNVVLAVLMDPLLLLLCTDTCVYVSLCSVVVCVCLCNCPFHCAVLCHLWPFSPVSAKYWRRCFGELSVSWK
ncbi:hypothetical protein Q5P01_016217 [Channa striata]|uniref:Uncharacterized protein n=1 Tax=Channa striata TaxID=64152 RepID=A0AA88MDN6_CHASR|nr:hypothetical protein Q5P01_016217 [Channa striata]